MLDISAIVLANVCVCYIMQSNNEEAEELIKRVEREEVLQRAGAKSFHCSIINLVIGTLYCCKNNYTFGIKRIVQALEPFDAKLGIDTW
jgi:tetratricopeptide repeat protein 30